MKSKQIPFNCIVIQILIYSIVIFVACPLPLKYIKFDKEGKSVKQYKDSFIEGTIALEIEGYYRQFGPELDFSLSITIKCARENYPIYFKPENITAYFKDQELLKPDYYWDSTGFETTDKESHYSIYFSTRQLMELDDEDIEYLKNTKYPIRISLDNFIFINDTAVSIDTLYATSPELTFYDKPMHRIRFISKGGTKEKIKIKLPENEITLELEGTTVDNVMPGVPLELQIKAEYEKNIPVRFYPEKVQATINDKPMDCRPDSLHMKFHDGVAIFAIDCACMFNKEEIKYIRETGNWIKISLDGFLEYNDSSIFIDTVLATAPKLKTYYSFKK